MDFRKFSMKLKVTFPLIPGPHGEIGEGKVYSVYKKSVMESPDFVFGCEEPKSKGIITRRLH